MVLREVAAGDRKNKQRVGKAGSESSERLANRGTEDSKAVQGHTTRIVNAHSVSMAAGSDKRG